MTDQFLLLTSNYATATANVIDINQHFGQVDIAARAETTMTLEEVGLYNEVNNVIELVNDVWFKFRWTKQIF